MSIREDATAGEVTIDEVERLLLLVEASGKLLGSPRLDAVLPAVLEVAQSILAADAYALWLRDTAADVWRLELAAGLSPGYQATATASVAQSPRTIELTGPFEVEDVERPDWVTAPHREAYAREGIRSLLALPLRVRGDLAGTLVFYYREPHSFQDSERRVGAALGGVAASAIATAQLVERQLRTAEERRFVVEASELLAATLDVEETLGRIAGLVVPALAGQCIVDLLEDDGSLRCVAVAHLDPDREELLRAVRLRYPPLAPGHPVQTVLATGEPQLLHELTDEAVAAMAQSEEHREQIRALGNTSGIVVPLIARGRILGAITLGTLAPQPPYRAEDVPVAAELGRHAAVAVDNARLYRAAEERAQAALALAYVGDGVALVDSGGVVRLWNRAAERLTGIPADALVGRLAADAVPGWSGVIAQVPVETGPGARAVTLPVEFEGRELWLSISAAGYPDGTVYAFRDLTEERALERMRTDFVSTVSHELRTPLAAIYGGALTLRREDLALADDQRDGLLDVIASESDRLARIVNDILWASRLDAQTLHVTLERCDVGTLASEVVNAARLHLPLRVELGLDLPSEPVVANCDRDKLRQVLTNLVDNAIKYSPDGGPVDVRVSGGDRARIAVRDEGLGIPPAEQSRIFEKFYRLDPNLTRGVGGTGLGLYICRELVRIMDGAIWVMSREQVGSTFTVELRPA